MKGEFVDSKSEGQGKITYADGTTYDTANLGQDGKIDGTGE